jgi:hypothetical protein
MLTAMLLTPWPRDTVTIVLLSGGTSIVVTFVAQVVMNARLVTHLRRHHAPLYESIGAPGIWWNRSANKSAVMWFVLGSRWASVKCCSAGAEPHAHVVSQVSRGELVLDGADLGIGERRVALILERKADFVAGRLPE